MGSAAPLTVTVSAPAATYADTLAALIAERAASRLFARDTTLWPVTSSAAYRLGWTDFERNALTAISAAEQIRAELDAQGIDRVVLCGMGGSSLAPEVIARWASTPLTVVDSTHPEFVAAALGADLSRTLVVISSKSGSTIETQSHRAAFTAAFTAAGLDPAQRIIVVTDPGSPIAAAARAAGQRVCFADPDVGGRFSALTAFGLVPTALAGIDVRALLAEACELRPLLVEDSPENPALQLAAAIFAGLPEQYVLGIIEQADLSWGLGTWIEQLVAESTGKSGAGVLPIALHPGAPEASAPPANLERVRVATAPIAHEAREEAGELEVVGGLGAQLLLWETATALLGHLMEIDPFNQPDVESAKVAARAVLTADAAPGSAAAATRIVDLPARLLASPVTPSPADCAELLAAIRSSIPRNGYLAIQAYLDPTAPYAEALERLRDALAQELEVPVALGWGPRYLHSVGQLHKGGPALGAFLQLSGGGSEEVPIPGSDSGFATLIAAQARGDREVLASRGRPVFALVTPAPDALIAQLLRALA
ncbi:glucose-6-phosphate isomerase [Leucobacter chromiireducens]|uniref:glucose-6-phosphate isomerase n=1 Tax=Leucobacter chromiireducens TaxID=283877 RepID=UPI000F63ECDC|nr:glucose-6-phosphate isomerase [Leucobacter chromiireducens]